MNQWNNISKGFFRENPVFVLFLGLCPTLGVTTSAINGLGMGLATTFVLLMSNIVVSLIKTFIPDKVRIPSYIVVIAAFVTIVELVMQDSYAIDRLSEAYPYPPQPLYQYMAADYWVLRDAGWSPDFPTTAGAYDDTCGTDGRCDPLGPDPLSDAFLTVIDPSGNGNNDLLYSTFLGGSDEDGANDVAISGGDAFVTGDSASFDFPAARSRFRRLSCPSWMSQPGRNV